MFETFKMYSGNKFSHNNFLTNIKKCEKYWNYNINAAINLINVIMS